MPGFRISGGYTASFRPPLTSVIISLLMGILVFFLFMNFSSAGSGEIYCVVSVDKNIPDRLAGDLLENAGFDVFYSESRTRIYYDDFGQWKELSLDRYRDYIESYDPRDSGYAENLRSFFINGDSRLLFIPVDSIFGRGAVSRKITAAFGQIPFTIDFIGQSGFFIFW